MTDSMVVALWLCVRCNNDNDRTSDEVIRERVGLEAEALRVAVIVDVLVGDVVGRVYEVDTTTLGVVVVDID